MTLTGRQIQQLRDALLDAYPTWDSLRMLVRIELDENLEAIAGGANQRVVIFNLVTWAEQNGRIDDLIAGAHNQLPGNPALETLAIQWHAQAAPDTKADATSPLEGVVRSPGPASVDLFLSYSRKDSSAMRQVLDALREIGLAVWTDEGLKPGSESWQDAITEALGQAKAMVVMLSPNANASAWVKREVILAQAQGKRIFPLLIAGNEVTAVPLGLIDAQRVDGRADLHQAVAQELLPALQSELGLAPTLSDRMQIAAVEGTPPSAHQEPFSKPEDAHVHANAHNWRNLYRVSATFIFVVLGFIFMGYLIARMQWSPTTPAGTNMARIVTAIVPEGPALVPSALQPERRVSGRSTLAFVDGVEYLQDTVSLDRPRSFHFSGNEDQSLRIQLLSRPAGANFELGGDNGVVYKSIADPALHWSMVLPITQSYHITVNSVSNAVFTLVATLGDDVDTPNIRFINFAPAQTTTVVTGTLQPNVASFFVINAEIGQEMEITLTSTPAESANFSVSSVRDNYVYKPLADPRRNVAISAPQRKAI